MTSISVCVALSPAQKSRLVRAVGDIQIKFCTTKDPINSEIVFGNPVPDILSSATRLRWVQLESVGFDEYLDLDLGTHDQRPKLTNLAGFFADPVAETALAGILAHGRGIERLVRYQSNAEWVGDPMRRDLRLLKNACIVMLGNGAINRRLAELLGPFDCKIIRFDSSASMQEIEQSLPAADILVAAVPDTPATHCLMNAHRLSLLPSHALFINLGRGSVVDEGALVSALRADRLGGVVLDVTNDEPLPVSHPFWTCPNTILTQHTGGGTTHELDCKIDYFLSNLLRYRAGQVLTGIVDLTRGY